MLTPAHRAELRDLAESSQPFIRHGGTDPAAVYVPAAELLALLDAADERDRLHEDHLAFTTPLGFGDGVTEPAARLSELVDSIHDALCDARDHLECPLYCGSCGEQLAGQTCEHCHGSGCGPGTASGAYEECEWCAGIGKVHTGCADMSYEDLAAERDRLAAQVRTLAEWHETKAMKARCFRSGMDGQNVVMDKAASVHDDAARRLRRALDADA